MILIICTTFVALLWRFHPAAAQCTDKTPGCSVILGDPARCYIAGNKDLCCRTCQTLNRGLAGCEYGDRSPQCKTLDYPYACYANENVCCGSCASRKNTGLPTGCEYGDKERWCKAPDMVYPADCYANDKVCCGSCAPLKNTSMPTDCRYGDKKSTCAALVANDMSICDVKTEFDLCCKSCGSIPSGPAVSAIDSSMKHSIEMRVVVDKFAFNKWKATVSSSLTEAEKTAETEGRLDKYIKALFQGVNNMYGKLKSAGISLDIRIASVEYVTKETVAKESSPGFGTTSAMLDDLKLWLSTNKYAKVDHTVLLTGLNISDGKGDFSVLGVAFLGKMCSSDSLSVVEAAFTGVTVSTLAHELGHSLSCQHDGDGNECSSDLHYVMAPSTGHNSTQGFQLSDCSVNYIKTKLKNLYSATGGNCLSAANTKAIPVTSEPLGKLYSPDEMCRLTVGETSYVYRKKYGGASGSDYSSICTYVWCTAPRPADANSYVLVPLTSADGITCGKDKECLLGFCKASSTPHDVKDTCALGDTPSYATVNYDNSQRKCSQLVTSSDASACYNSQVYSMCCASCEKVKKSTAGCEYGDKQQWCRQQDMVYPYDCYDNDEVCCGSCAPLKNTSKPAGCEYGDMAAWCKDQDMVYPAACYANEKVCCGSCAALKTVSRPGCEYGDRYNACVASLHCPTYASSHCCATCAKAG